MSMHLPYVVMIVTVIVVGTFKDSVALSNAYGYASITKFEQISD